VGVMSQTETRATARSDLDQTIPVVVVLGALAAAAWALLASGAVHHPSHDALLGSGHLPRLGALAAFLGQWQLMVAAMMLPPAIPAAVARARRTGRWWSTVSTVVATTGVVWTGFVVAVLAGDAVVHRLVATWSWLGNRQWLVASAVLLVAGAVHLAPWERHALARARATAGAAHGSAWRYATACLGSCWALMLVMLAADADSLLWMAFLATVMLVQRVTRYGARLAPLVGLGLLSLAVEVPFHSGALL
jgi:predicted metal-binding membrane protein